MPKPSNKQKLLTEGLRVVHERGFAGASVGDVVQAAGVPRGSFTNHFPSKELFGVEVLNLYYSQSAALARTTLRDDSADPLQRLKAWVDGTLNSLNQDNEWNGCLLGNFGAGTSSETGLIADRVTAIFNEIQSDLAYCLKAAVKAGQLPAKTDCKELAGFIHAALEGSVLRAKAIRNSSPTVAFRRLLFTTILRP